MKKNKNFVKAGERQKYIVPPYEDYITIEQVEAVLGKSGLKPESKLTGCAFYIGTSGRLDIVGGVKNLFINEEE